MGIGPYLAEGLLAGDLAVGLGLVQPQDLAQQRRVAVEQGLTQSETHTERGRDEVREGLHLTSRQMWRLERALSLSNGTEE